MVGFDDEDDRPVGRPIQAPLARPAAPATIEPPEEPPVEGVREGETIWRPAQTPAVASALSPQDQERLRRAQAEEEAAEARRIEELLAAEPTLFRLPGLIRHPLVATFLLAALAVLGLFLFAQVTETLAALASLPPHFQYAGYAGLGLLLVLLLWSVLRFAWAFVRYNPSKPLRLKGLEELARRTQLRHLVVLKRTEARDQLHGWVEGYALETEADRRALTALGLEEGALQLLTTARRDLLDVNRFTSTEEWFRAVQARFQTILDEAAGARVGAYARRVAILTAASPNTLVDVVVTMTCSFALLADLCRIYHLRMSRFGTAVLLGRIFFHAYLAGQLNEWETVAEQGIQTFVAETGLHMGSLAADALAARAAGKLGARAASGVLNYMLLRRMGTYAIGLLRPLHLG